MTVATEATEALSVAAVQLDGGETSKGNRIARLCELVRELSAIDLVVLPELWPTGYFNQSRYAGDAERLGDGEAQAALSLLAKELEVWIIGGSIVERAPGGALYNTTPVVSPTGETVATYRKRHLFGHGSQEARLLRPGTAPTSIDIAGVSVGLALCYDLRFPEAFVDYVASGCELYVVSAAWPRVRVDHWNTLIAARAIEGQAFCIGCNTAGSEGDTDLGGESVIVDPWGRCLERAGDLEDVAVATLDLGGLREYREAFSALDQRRRAIGGGRRR
ncbi:MAG: carbon-nitrogen family hydrolase [Gemmatimonas sp.]|nr:carbon-nitrogen family hydrolase [Gemmatimonas sp.]